MNLLSSNSKISLQIIDTDNENPFNSSYFTSYSKEEFSFAKEKPQFKFDYLYYLRKNLLSNIKTNTTIFIFGIS